MRCPVEPTVSNAWPHQRIWPCVGLSIPANIFSSVLLPHPDGPSKEMNSPGSMESRTSSSATVPFG
jgi:hypothetical protein